MFVWKVEGEEEGEGGGEEEQLHLFFGDNFGLHLYDNIRRGKRRRYICIEHFLRHVWHYYLVSQCSSGKETLQREREIHQSTYLSNLSSIKIKL